MNFKLTEQGINTLIEKHGVKKSLIIKIEKEINMLNVVKNSDDYIELIDNVLLVLVKMSSGIKIFSDGNDKLIVKIPLEQVVLFEIIRKYGMGCLTNYNVKELAKKYIDNKKLNYTRKEKIKYYINQGWTDFHITDKTKEEVLNNPKRYSGCDFKIRNGMFRTEEEQEKYIQKSLKRKLP